MTAGRTWKVCSICKTPIDYGTQYFVCSVSTCRQKRTGLVFCSLSCFEAHLPMMRHRDAWAEQEVAPSSAAAAERAEETPQNPGRPSSSLATKPPASGATTSEPRRRIVGAASAEPVSEDDPKDVLVVVSKLKKYIRVRSGMNTSDGVVDVLSDHLRHLSTAALRHAAADGRKTVLDRDFEAVLDGILGRKG